MKLLTLFLVLTGTIIHSSAQEWATRIQNLVPENSGGPGVNLEIFQNGNRIYSIQYGLANLEFAIPITSNTRFAVASVSKQFTAACVGILVREGKLSLKDDIRQYIPELPDYGKTIRIRHLLDHTSGIRNYNVLLDLSGFDDSRRGYSTTDIQQLIFRQKGVNHVPGEKMLYSNSNYALLALLVQRVSGMNLKDFAATRLFEPLNMHHTHFSSGSSEVVDSLAGRYGNENGKWVRYFPRNYIIGPGGARSTSSDLHTWSRIFLDPGHRYAWLGEFLAEASTLNNGKINNYARGVFVDEYRRMRTLHHSGRDWGVRSALLIIPEKKMTIVALANSASDATDLVYRAFDAIYQTNDEEQIHSYNKDIDLSAFTGDYQEKNSDLGMKIFVENDTLKARSSFGRTGVPLEAISSTSFQRLNDPSVRHSFFPEGADADMAVDFGGAIFYFERVKLVDAKQVDIHEYTGSFYSEELNVWYTLKSDENRLVLSFENNPTIHLFPGQKDEFGSGRRTRYSFSRNGGEVQGFTVASEGTVKDIWFEKK